MGGYGVAVVANAVRAGATVAIGATALTNGGSDGDGSDGDDKMN